MRVEAHGRRHVSPDRSCIPLLTGPLGYARAVHGARWSRKDTPPVMYARPRVVRALQSTHGAAVNARAAWHEFPRWAARVAPETSRVSGHGTPRVIRVRCTCGPRAVCSLHCPLTAFLGRLDGEQAAAAEEAYSRGRAGAAAARTCQLLRHCPQVGWSLGRAARLSQRS